MPEDKHESNYRIGAVSRLTGIPLAAASTISTAIKCECPHHLADLILSLCHFEEYSARCESQSREDAALHAYLHVTTAKARHLMEQALQKAIEVEGIDLDAQPSQGI